MSAFTDAFEANTPKDYPNLSCGWPDAEHGINWDGYIQWAERVLADLDEGDDIGLFLKFDEWKRIQREKDEERDNLGFSFERCDLCYEPPGDRHAATAHNEDLSDYIALSICNSCIMYIANGEEPDDEG